MRRSSVVILATGSLATLAGAWMIGSPVLLAALTVEENRPAPQPDSSTNASSDPSAAVSPVPSELSSTPTAPPPPVTVTVDGSVIDTTYGTVQVQAVITDGVLVDVIALKLTDTSETSVTISANAAPILREEVLAAQSTAVANVSGATYTSEAYLSSLQAALDSQP